MDFYAITSKQRLKNSPIPGMYFRRQWLKKDANRKTVNWAPFKADWNPLNEFASKRSWQREYKACQKQGERELNRFLINSLLKTEFLKNEKVPEFCIPEFDIASLDFWSVFRGYAAGYSAFAPDHPARKVIDFLLTQEELEMSGVETVIWMLIAHQELTLVESGYEIGAGNNPNSGGLVFDIENWMPVEENNKLTSTKRRVLKVLYDLYSRKSNRDNNADFDEQRRVFRELMKPVYLTPDAKLSLSKECRFDSYIPQNMTDSISGENRLSAEKAFKKHLDLLINYAEFFEYVQSSLLNTGFTHKEIIDLFSVCTNIKCKFYEDLKRQL